ncbi:MAG: hypothetical protein C0467_11845 [Planctomycetaceae bacterium]|nr:hypothetical protein [Planctomycetaceae bacterium]
MLGRPLAGMLLTLLLVGPLLADDAPPRDKLAGLEVRMWEWRRLRNQIDMLPLTGMIVADGPKLPDVSAFDKLVVDALREVHNRGADLYNTTRDFDGAFRTYQGGLVAVKPLLNHRPEAQKLIEDGLAAADKEPTPARKAFKLHETIEAVRKSLKDANEPPIKPIKPDPKPVEPVVEPKPKPIKPIEPDPKTKSKDPVEPAPNPKAKDPTEPKKTKEPAEPKKPKDPNPVSAKSTGITGKLTLKGQPLAAGELTIVSLGLAQPRVYSTAVKEGSYSFAEVIPPGKYVVIVAAKGIPEKFQTTTSSGIMIDVKAGASSHDFDLK